jgi:glycine cleavage system aminomethyltransferase T
MKEQHLATRRAAGLFDFSFMSLCEISGSGAVSFLERLQTRSLAALAPGQIAYTLLLREDAAVFIDATLWRHADGRWWLFTGRRSDVAWIIHHAAGFDVRVRERCGEFAILALQGPASGRALSQLIGEPPTRSLRYFRFLETNFRSTRIHVGRLGFSGELGYEILLSPSEASTVRKDLVGQAIVECGFEAANSLRIESGYVLFDREITGRENPLELGLERLVNLGGRDFIGRQAFSALRRSPTARRLVGLEISDRSASPLLPLARPTSECDSPIFRRRIGLGFTNAQNSDGSAVRLADGRLATIARLPFYDAARRLPREASI